MQERRTAAAAEALGHPQVLRRGLWALGRAPRLQEAQLEVAWRRHTQALLAQSFQKVRGLPVGPWGGDERLVCLGRGFLWGTCSVPPQ